MSTFVIFIDLARHFMGCTFAQRQVSKIGNFFQVWNLFFFGVIKTLWPRWPTQLFAIDLLSHSFGFIWDNHGLQPISSVSLIPEHIRCTKECSHSKNRLKPCETTGKKHLPMYIHTIPYQSIQVQTKKPIESHNLLNPDSFTLFVISPNSS